MNSTEKSHKCSNTFIPITEIYIYEILFLHNSQVNYDLTWVCKVRLDADGTLISKDNLFDADHYRTRSKPANTVLTISTVN